MTKTIKVALAGAGAFGLKHLDGIKLIDGVEVVSLVGRELDKTQEAAKKYGVGHVDDRSRRDAEAAGTRRGDPGDADPDARRPDDPVPRGRQARAGRDSARRQPEGRRGGRRDAEEDRPRRHGAATPGASIRATSSCTSGSSPDEFHIQQMDVQTYFFRRTNMNALGQPRSWTDHLLWHHAAHTVDLFAYQAARRS